MKIFNKILGSGICAILATSFFSCSDNLEVIPDLPGENGSTLTIYIPNVNAAAHYGATRSDEFQNTRALDDANEAVINSLWFFAYPVSEDPATDNREPVIKSLDPKSPSSSGSNEFAYSTYQVGPFQDGDYHIYLLANIQEYINETLSTSTSEETVEDLILNFESPKKYPEFGHLPMACLNTEVRKDQSGNPERSGKFTIKRSDGTGQKVYCDLTFLCAKVRYTILFDKKDFSNKFSSNNVGFDTEKAKATKIVKETKLVGDGTSPEGFFESDRSLTLKKVLYPEVATGKTSNGYLTAPPTYEEDLTEIDGTNVKDWKDQDQKAWQGVIYLPENLNSGDDRTKLQFTATGSEVNTEEYHYEIPLFENNTTKLERGKFYDVIAHVKESTSVKIPTTVSVKDWTTQELSYTLHGPYELIVETTQIEVSSKTPTYMWYRSDIGPEDIHFKYPKIQYKGGPTNGRDFYVASVYKENDQYILNENGDFLIEIKINPSIPSAVLNAVDNSTDYDGFIYNKEDYRWYEIIAGNIQKKIKVDLTNLEPFFRVTPNNIIIDMKEYITSGFDSRVLDILVESNISNTINYTCDYDNIFNGNGELTITSGEGLDGEIDNSSFTIIEGIGHLNLNLRNLFEGKVFWKTFNEINIKFISSDGSNNDEEDLKIIIKPFSTDYTIHFKPIESWTSPHIYIYQCLDMPSDLSDKSIAGKTVGYGTGQDGQAGLEFLFTNNVAFRGWLGYGGTVDPLKDNTKWDGGFVQWGGSTYADYFNPSNSHTEIYNYEADLNSQNDITKATHCEACKAYSEFYHYNGYDFKLGKNYDAKDHDGYGGHQWAGVAMIPEEDGWYKYVLSGIATPGKAMIMFNDGHTGNGNEGSVGGHRYPESNEVGVPLFDFPDNEGWFYFDGYSSRHDLNFSNTKPTKAPQKWKLKLYWNKSIQTPLIYLWGWKGSEFEGDYYSHEGTLYGNYYYKEFDITSSYGKLGYKFPKICSDDNNHTHYVILDKFNIEGNSIIGYIDREDGSWQAGRPAEFLEDPSSHDSSTSFVNGDKVTIRWTKTYSGTTFEGIYVWDISNDKYKPLGEFGGVNDIDDSDANYYETEFTVDRTVNNFGIDINHKYGDNAYNEFLFNASINSITRQNPDRKNWTAGVNHTGSITTSKEGVNSHYTITIDLK